MCLIVFAWDVHPKYKLILAANRDEFYDRPSAPAAFWKEHPQLLGGRDLQAGGSWMTVSRTGQFAAVTNYRDLRNLKEGATSRGEIPTQFSLGSESPGTYLERLNATAEQYNGFNVLVGNMSSMAHYSNYERQVNALRPGIYGLSNSLLDTGWPKVERAKLKFGKAINQGFQHEELLDMMCDHTVAEDAHLPDTGIPYELEKALSAMCIRTENYGTCCTTVITLARNGKIAFSERSYPVGNRVGTTVDYEFMIER